MLTILLIPWVGIVLMSPMMVAAGGFKDNLSAIGTAMFLLGYPVILFAALTILGGQYFGMEAHTWLIGSLIVTIGIFLLYKFPGMLLNLLRGIPNSGYFISDIRVYFDGAQIPKAHPGSFETLTIDARYAKDHFHLFFNGRLVKNADPITFAPVTTAENQSFTDSRPSYWKDKAHVFYEGKMIKNADPESFSYTHFYAWDTTHVYFVDKELENTDPKKFTILKQGLAREDHSIFVFGKRSATIVDHDTFEIVENGDNIFCKDKNSVYVLFYKQADPLVKIEDADPLTFKLLERSYAQDKNHIYYYGFTGTTQSKPTKLEGVNPNTFVIGYDPATKSEARDGLKYFMYGKLVKQGSQPSKS
jgi:hypothetical protein